MTKKINILYFADQWDNKWRRRQQFAKRLADDNQVIIIEYPLPLTSLFKYYLGRADIEATNRWRRVHKYGTIFSPQNNITVITPIVPFRQFSDDAISIHIIKRKIYRHIAATHKKIVTHPFWSRKVFDSLSIKSFDLYDITEDFTQIQGQSLREKNRICDNDDYLTQNSKAVVCVSQSLFSRKSKQRSSVHYIPNGVDTEKLNPNIGTIDIHKIFSIAKENKILLYAGGINNRFDFELILEILKARPEWTLILVGSYDVNDVNIRVLMDTGNCHFTGQVSLDEVGIYINSSDICLIPHKVNELTKSQSTQKIYNYMALGKPVVASNVGGLPELIDDNLTGMLTTPKDSRSIANAFLMLCSDIVLRHKMGGNAKEKVYNNFTWNIVTKKTLDVYHSVL